MKGSLEYILFARSIPEHSKKYGGLFSCSVGYSPTLKELIRIYPIPLTGLKMWERYSVPVEKNKLDSREESYKLASYARYENWVGLDKDVIYIGKYSRDHITKTIFRQVVTIESISDLNKAKKSIAIIKADNVNCSWEPNDRYINTNQFGLFEDVGLAGYTAFTKDTRQLEARVRFTNNGKQHDLQVNEWGIYEFYRKFHGVYPVNDAFKNWKNATHLLIGNLHSIRNVWVVLNYFNA
jgi:hypothetical protein